MSDEPASTISSLEYQTHLLLKEGIDLSKREITLTKEIGKKAVLQLQKGLSLLETLGEDPVTINVFSDGGCVYSMFAIIDIIRGCKLEIITRGTGLVASAAVPILASGDIRVATKHTTIMWHAASYSAPYNRLSNQEAEMKHVKELDKKVNAFMAEVTDRPYTFWAATGKHTDHYFNSETALEYGIIDEVEG